MTTFNEKKEADLSGKRTANNRGPKGSKSNSTPNKGKGKEKESKKEDKVNGSSPAAETKTENGVTEATTNGEEATEA